MRKRVLFIITQSEFGGAQRFLSTFVPKLDSEKYEVLVATGSTGDEHFTEHLINQKIPNTTLRHLVRNSHPWHDLLAIFEIRRLIQSFKPNILFLLSTKAGFLGSLASCYMLHVTCPRVIYRIGGWAFNDPQSALRRRIIIWAEKLSAKWKDIIIVNNKNDLKQAQDLGICGSEKIKLIHNGLDVYKLKFLDREKARAKLSPKKIIIGTIANFYPSKGLEYFIESAQSFKNRPDIAFVIIGDGILREKLEKKIADFGLKNTVHLAGRLSEAYRYMPGFDIFVSPSVKEGFQWAVLEAMAAKVPVIATTAGASTEIIENGKNGFLAPLKNAKEISDKISRLLENERLRQDFSIQGHQTVLLNFDLDRMVLLYSNIINSPS